MQPGLPWEHLKLQWQNLFTTESLLGAIDHEGLATSRCSGTTDGQERARALQCMDFAKFLGLGRMSSRQIKSAQ